MATAGTAGPKISRALAAVRRLKNSAGKIGDRVVASQVSAMLLALRRRDYGRAGRLADRISRAAK